MRPRYQAPEPYRIGDKWYARYYDVDGIRRRVLLDAKNPTQARAKLAEILGPVNTARADAAPSLNMTLGNFVSTVYIPLAETNWKSSTRVTSISRIKQHIVNGEIGELPLKDITRPKLQAYLNSKRDCSYSVIKHIKFDLVAICRLAMADGLLKLNPTLFLKITEFKVSPPRLMMGRDEIVKILEVLPIRERLFVRFAIFAGMRPGEILALKWENFSGASVLIKERMYKGLADSPKGRKGRDTTREIALSTELLKELAIIKGGAEAGYLFLERTGKQPESYSNMWSSRIKPLFEKVGLGWCTFQVMRRTWSSFSKSAGAGGQAVADQLGHTVQVDLADYTFSSMADKLDAVNRFNDWVWPKTTHNSNQAPVVDLSGESEYIQ